MTMTIPFLTCDVFTDRPFGGNQLAVIPDAGELSGELMQSLAREFNYAESTFALPCDDGVHDFEIRIFTPTFEMPFAGHPIVGTAHVLHELGRTDGPVTFKVPAGTVRVSHSDQGFALTAPQPFALSSELPEGLAARLVSLSLDQLDDSFTPVNAGCGVNFAFAKAADYAALKAAVPDAAAFRELEDGKGLVLFLTGEEAAPYDVRVRMFAPGLGITEDAATGSAAVAVAGIIHGLDGRKEITIGQGIEMGRPSTLYAVSDGKTCGVGGTAVTLMRGEISL